MSVVIFCSLCTLRFSLLSSNIYNCNNISAHVDSTNRAFNVTIDTGSRTPVAIFHFLNGPVTSANCTIQYGTDPTYMNLPNNDSSTGTNVNSMTVPLSTPLLADTLYYCLVSSVGVQMQGTFRLGMLIYIQIFYTSSCMHHILRMYLATSIDIDVF